MEQLNVHESNLKAGQPGPNDQKGLVYPRHPIAKRPWEGRISGAGLDVLETEPPDSGNPMLKMENVIFSPHVGFYSEESISELKHRTAKNVADVLRGRKPRSVVNREVMMH